MESLNLKPRILFAKVLISKSAPGSAIWFHTAGQLGIY